MKCQLLLLSLASSLFLEAKDAEFIPVADAPKIQTAEITEASGLAASSYDPEFLWIVNDSGGTHDIHLVDTQGTYRGKVSIKDASNIDWEDLASFSLDGKPYLLVADTGDNNSKRESSVIYIIPEPTLPEKGKSLNVTIPPAWQIRFQYEGGPRDCEAVAVDAKAGKIILISKRTHPPEVYELPLEAPKHPGILTAHLVGKCLVKSTGGIGRFLNQPTGLDFNCEGSLAAVVTYQTIFLFPRQPEESWAEALSRAPQALAPHGLGQAESVAFSKDGKTIYSVSEGKTTPIRIYRRK